MGSPWRNHGEFIWPNPHGKLMDFSHEIFMGYFCKGSYAWLFLLQINDDEESVERGLIWKTRLTKDWIVERFQTRGVFRDSYSLNKRIINRRIRFDRQSQRRSWLRGVQWSNILVFRHQRSLRKSAGFTPNGGAKYRGVAKLAIFDQYAAISRKR